jgi:hypothetical protein
MDDDQGSGWLTFSAVILVFAGLMKVFDSIWAFRTKGQLAGELVSGGTGHATLGATISNYGWYWLFLGVVLILAGFAVIGGSQVGRWIGIIAAAVGAIGTMAWMPYYPIWALTYFIIAILVMYGLAAHGGLEVPSQVSRS